MPGRSDQERTEPATQKRREEARKRGQVAQSREIPSALVLLCAFGVLCFWGLHMLQGLSGLLRGVFQNMGTLQLNEDLLFRFLLEVMWKLFVILMPLMVSVLAGGIGANLLQVGFLFSAAPLTPSFSKLSPVEGIKRLFSLKSLAEVVKSILKVIFVGGIAYIMVRRELESIPSLMQMEIWEILSFFGRVCFKICIYTCLSLMLLAAVDYAFQRWQHEKSLKMTKQEVKDELKQREGDPAVKARIRSIQREMARRRMMEAVPEADVVVTNPIHLAVALKYDPNEMMAPRVIAKGAELVAERIKETAKAHGVPLVEDKVLAQTLFKSVEIGQFIPVSLYQAIAEVLAYVYQLRGNKGVER
jgi:flagellar biosynthetic protein FlhB